MTIDEMIQESVQKLPAEMKAEVLDFVEYLLTKTEHEIAPSDDENSADLSLTLAMRDMEEETVPEYTRADLKVIFA
jgi:hypothetical protein